MSSVKKPVIVIQDESWCVKGVPRRVKQSQASYSSKDGSWCVKGVSRRVNSHKSVKDSKMCHGVSMCVISHKASYSNSGGIMVCQRCVKACQTVTSQL